MKSTRFVKDLMSNDIHSVNENDSLTDLVTLFEGAHIGGVPVRSTVGDYVGVISKSDLVSHQVIQAMKRHADPDHLSVRHFMNPTRPITISEYKTVDEAIEQMRQHDIHRLFVTDVFGDICGVICASDLMKSARPRFQAVTRSAFL